jgi:hypothetical protein
MIDPQFTYAFAHRPHVASISKCETIEAGRDQRACPLILELGSPFTEGLGLLEFEHR